MDMIIRAGGMTRYAGVEQIRIIHNNQPIPFNMKLYLDTVNPSYMPPISGGDVIFVPQKVQGVDSGAKTVYVIGEVHKPGSFEIQKSISFLEMLSNSGGPTRYADPRHIKIIKRDKIIPFDMIRYVNNKNLQVPMVEAGDAIFVPYKHNMIEGAWLNIPSDKAVEIIGLVNKPGRYEWASDMNFFDYLGHAGGATRRGNTSMVEILIPQDDGTRKGFLFDMERFLRQGGNESQLPQITGGTVINIPALPDDPRDNKSQWIKQSSDSSIYVFGEVGSPGRYAFNSSLNLLDIITAADSTTKEADLRNITITHRHDEKSKVSRVNLSRYFQTGDESLLPKILPEDVIYVPEKSEFANWLDIDKEFTIRVLGEVKKPGRYRFEESMTILDLLAAAEGFTADAMEERIVVVNSTYHHGNNSRLFNMVEFAKTGDFDMLPLVKVGDTVYVPHDNQSHWERVAGTMRDLASVVLAPLLLLTGIK
jgi:protein involved in polysaccharide export with SLBB domain